MLADDSSCGYEVLSSVGNVKNIFIFLYLHLIVFVALIPKTVPGRPGDVINGISDAVDGDRIRLVT